MRLDRQPGHVPQPAASAAAVYFLAVFTVHAQGCAISQMFRPC
jgi:hypothetical protein